MAVKCKNGHWYDPNMHRSCPHCKRASEQLSLALDDVVEDDRTVSIAEVDLSLGEQLGRVMEEPILNVANDIVNLEEELTDSDKTVSFGFFDLEGVVPVVGWLVCIRGEERGKDYRLHTGKNFIGRSHSMDVVLVDDKTISRDRHCSVIYDPVSTKFYLLSEGGNIVYHNGRIVETASEIRNGDIVIVGHTALAFIPYCQEGRTWDER